MNFLVRRELPFVACLVARYDLSRFGCQKSIQVGLGAALSIVQRRIQAFRNSVLNKGARRFPIFLQIAQFDAHDTAERMADNQLLSEGEQQMESASHLFLQIGVIEESILIILLLLLAFNIILLVRNRKRTRAFSEHKQRAETARSRELMILNSMVEGEEKERRRIGLELHDNIGSLLGALRMQASLLRESVKSEAALNELETIEKLIDETADQTRRLSHNLISGIITKQGLIKALLELAQQLNASSGVDIRLNDLDSIDRLAEKVELNLFRIAQELISNALKHSFADQITITIFKRQDRLCLVVQDNGIGLPEENEVSSVGVGISNIEGRVKALNGEVEFHSEPGSGTKVEVQVPIASEIHADEN